MSTTDAEIIEKFRAHDRQASLVSDAVRDLLPTGARIDQQGLHLPPDLPFDEYFAVGQHLMWLHTKLTEALTLLNFAIGDWLVYGEHVYGEKYLQAAEVTGKSVQRLKNLRWVAAHIPKGRRRPLELSFEHHVEVAALAPGQQWALLDRAVREDLTREDLRREKHLLGPKAAQYNREEAELALNKAADMLAEVPWQDWAKLIMAALVQPLRHEIDRNSYRSFVIEFFTLVHRWRDRT